MAVIARDATIVNELGMHARPAATFVKTAARFGASIRVSKGDLEVNGKSIMGVLMLAAECATLVVNHTGIEKNCIHRRMSSRMFSKNFIRIT